MFATLAATGLRLGELCGLTWRSLDLAEGLVHVREQVTRAVRVDYEHLAGGKSPLKTGRARRTLELPLDVGRPAGRAPGTVGVHGPG